MDEPEPVLSAYTQLENFFRVFTYKPGWSFKVERRYRPEGWEPKGYEEISVAIYAEFPDVHHPERMVPVGKHYIFPESALHTYAPELIMMKIIHNWIRDLEFHEIDEWFRVDGVAVYDPHKAESEPSRQKRNF
jgi:hypothetical protein